MVLAAHSESLVSAQGHAYSAVGGNGCCRACWAVLWQWCTSAVKVAARCVMRIAQGLHGSSACTGHEANSQSRHEANSQSRHEANSQCTGERPSKMDSVMGRTLLCMHTGLHGFA